MRKIWHKFCDWIVEKFGGITVKTFEHWMSVKNQQIKETEDRVRFIKADYDEAYNANIKLFATNTHLLTQLNDANKYIEKMRSPKREFVKIGYIATYPISYTNDNIEYIVTNGLLEKIRESGAIKYDYHDGECVASIEVVL